MIKLSNVSWNFEILRLSVSETKVLHYSFSSLWLGSPFNTFCTFFYLKCMYCTFNTLFQNELRLNSMTIIHFKKSSVHFPIFPTAQFVSLPMMASYSCFGILYGSSCLFWDAFLLTMFVKRCSSRNGI